MNSEVPICALTEGQRFTLLLETTGRKILGRLLRVGSGSATVLLERGPNTRTFGAVDKKTGELRVIVVQESARTEHWSLSTPVIPLAQSPSVRDS